jgi:GNAT superfamily N-acetyltransferase
MDSPPLFRSAGSQDIPALVELRLEFMRIIKDGGIPDEDGWRQGLEGYFSAWMARGRLKAWLAQDGAQVVATAALRLDRPRRDRDRGWDGYVMSVYTRPEWRRQGLGRALMLGLIREASSLGLARLVLHPTPESVPLYSSLGFRPFRTVMILGKESFHEAQD